MINLKKRKNFGRKIKRSRVNLYPKRKTKAQKVLGTVFLIIILLGIVFLGYCLGKPLLDYFGNQPAGTDDPAWTPPSDVTTSQPTETEDISMTTAAPSTTVTEPPAADENHYAISIPASALSNTSSLSAYAAKAKSEGYTVATVRLKDSAGYLRYASEVERVKGSDAAIGTLTAAEIYTVLSQNGLSPVAVISVLADNLGCINDPDMSYKVIDEDNISWLDYKGESPIRWASPESAATISYINEIIAELKKAGFADILLSDVIYPDFQDYDRKFIDSRYFSAERYKYLMSVVPDNVGLVVYADDVILNAYNKSAEVLKNKTELSGITTAAVIRRESFSAENGYPADASGLFEDVMSQLTVMNPNLNFIPVIESKNFTPADIADMKEKAESMGYKEFYVW